MPNRENRCLIERSLEKSCRTSDDRKSLQACSCKTTLRPAVFPLLLHLPQLTQAPGSFVYKSKNSGNKNTNKSAVNNKQKPVQQASGKEDNLGAADNDYAEEEESDNPENETVEEYEEEKQPVVKHSVYKTSKQSTQDAYDNKEDNDDYFEINSEKEGEVGDQS